MRDPVTMTRSELINEVSMWRSLWCDQPEDRLYHAKDRTWWRRMLDGFQARPYAPRLAAPPPEIMRIVRAARKIKNLSRVLRKDLSYFPE